MVKREYWIQQIENSWLERPIIWLAGVRRSGKTSLCKSLENVEYYNCELPRVKELLKDPEQFYLKSVGDRIVLDEIHILDDPSLILKIGADEFPHKRIIATGSSTLGAQKKFSDTLTGRKFKIHLTPMLPQESKLFGSTDLLHRLLYGGLPPFFMSSYLPEKEYLEWYDSYFARDVKTIYKISNHETYIKFVELLLAQSGGIFDATRFAEECEVSRPTIVKYLHIVQQTLVAKIVRPFSSRSSSEIISAPKVYGFDTGFICYAKGWESLRKEYYGDLWEHFVLNAIMGKFQTIKIKYWRDKRGHEIDFVLQKHRNKLPITVECKWSYRHFDPRNLKAFRRRYPDGRNFLIAADIIDSFDRVFDGITVSFISIEEFLETL